ncbi:hypothetical protein ACMFMG_004378 [Clarireedia jacksonii]
MTFVEQLNVFPEVLHLKTSISLGLVFVAATLYALFRKRYWGGLDQLPGPLLASISDIWRWNAVWHENIHIRSLQLHNKYGPLVRIGPKCISVSSPEGIQAIYVNKKGLQKAPMYGILQPMLEGSPLHNIFSTSDIEYHSSLKRTIGSLYSFSALKDIQPNLDRCVLLFIDRLGDLAKSGPVTVDMSAWLQFYTFDSLGEVNFSQPMGFLASGTDVDGICELDHHMMRHFALWGQVLSFEGIVSRWKSLTGDRVTKPNPLFHFTLDIIEKRIMYPTDSVDILNKFLQLHNTAPDRLPRNDLAAAIYINVVTAHDVIAITLRAILYYLCRTPRVYNILYDEISRMENLGKLSTPAQYHEVSSMIYLSAVIDETLRIHPSTGIIFERIVPSGGITLHGTYIPENTIVGSNAWVTNRNKEVFGDDIDCFRPERWIGIPSDKTIDMRRNILTWGAGARVCIGKNLAMMQIAPVIVELYRNFDIKLADPGKEWHVSGGWLTRQTEMDMILNYKK